MDEPRLRELGRQAEELVDLPSLAALERRGRAMRFRRQVGVVAAATLLAATGTWFVQDRSPATLQPAPPPDVPAGAQPWPGPEMQDLESGTYELFPSAVSTEPTALVTVPKGWNSWKGPNRFNGHRSDDPTEGAYKEPALDRRTWYAGLLVVKLTGVSRATCMPPSSPNDFFETYGQTVEAVAQLPGYRQVGQPVSGVEFGHPATHFVLRQLPATRDCPDYNPLATSANGTVGGDARIDLWVVDVDGTPLSVIAGTSGDVPARIRAELAAIVDSVEFVVVDK